MRSSGLGPVAAQLAAPVALGLLIGGVLAYQAGSTNNPVQPVPLGAVATPTPSFGAPSATARGAIMPPAPSWLSTPSWFKTLAPLTPSAAAASPSASPSPAASSAASRPEAASPAGG